MTISAAYISIIAITAVVFLINKKKFLKPVCPICAGVSLTWIWLFIANLFGASFDLVIIGILMGGTIVGIAYSLEKNYGIRYSDLLFKTLFISLGFLAVYQFIYKNWLAFLISLFLLLATIFIFVNFWIKPEKKYNQSVEKIKQKLDDCC